MVIRGLSKGWQQDWAVEPFFPPGLTMGRKGLLVKVYMTDFFFYLLD